MVASPLYFLCTFSLRIGKRLVYAGYRYHHIQNAIQKGAVLTKTCHARCRTLLAGGASPGLKDIYKNTALWYARDNEYHTMVAVLDDVTPDEVECNTCGYILTSAV